MEAVDSALFSRGQRSEALPQGWAGVALSGERQAVPWGRAGLEAARQAGPRTAAWAWAHTGRRVEVGGTVSLLW